MKNRIIICGYPKSGNTWLTRLTADLVGCPVRGFWCEPFNKEIAIEGLSRESKYTCYKAHHSRIELLRTFKDYGYGNEKIIYIVRDPRDVILSASNYFPVSPRYPKLYRVMKNIPNGSFVYDKLFSPLNYRLKIFSDGILKGTNEGAWLQVPWSKHVEGYLEVESEELLILRYEDLLNNVVHSSKTILDFLGVSRSESEILDSCKRQSFSEKRNYYKEIGDKKRADFMRIGQSGRGAKELGSLITNEVECELDSLMRRLGYIA